MGAFCVVFQLAFVTLGHGVMNKKNHTERSRLCLGQDLEKGSNMSTAVEF